MAFSKTTNMGLTLSDVGANPGNKFLPTPASMIQGDLSIVDGHNHLQSGGPGTNGALGAPIVVVTAPQLSTLTVVPTAPLYEQLVDTSSAQTVLLPPSNGALGATKGFRLTIKDATGNAGNRAITITANGSDRIDGVVSKTITTNYGFLTLVSDGVGAWYVVGSSSVEGVSTVQSSNFNVAPGASVYTALVNTAAAVTATLATAGPGTNGYRVTIKDATGTANVHNITIQPQAGDSIDLGGAATINTAFGFKALVSDGAGKWYSV